MSLVIKCSGTSSTISSEQSVVAYAFTVRWHHRIVHSAAAAVCPGTACPRSEAVRNALLWLLAQGRPARAVIRVDGPYCPEASDSVLALLLESGWEIQVQQVSPEWVSEAASLARRLVSAIGRRRPQRKYCEPAQAAPAQAPAPARAQPGHDLLIICDGGYKPPSRSVGLAAYAFVARHRSDLIHREKGVVCHGPAAGSQMAELGALVASLRWLVASPLAAGARVQLHCDCEGVVHAVTGRARIRMRRGSVMLSRTVARLLSRLHRRRCRVAISHTPRKRVREADSMCRKVYKEQLAGRPVRRSVKAFLRSV